jgi:ABC-type sugar transport system permease subunit
MTAILTFDIVYVLTGGGPGDSTALISWFAYAEIYKFLNLGGGCEICLSSHRIRAAWRLTWGR